MKPYAESCERNQRPILEVLTQEFSDIRTVLEVGSGTGQHAIFFGARLPHLVWQTSDLAHAHAGILTWLAEAKLDNVRPPLAIDVNDDDWGIDSVEAIYTANTMHILSWKSISRMFAGFGKILAPSARVALYGPFRFDGQYTSESNAAFDRHLRSRDPLGGIRDFESLDELAQRQGLRLRHNYSLPSNNQILVWGRDAGND